MRYLSLDYLVAKVNQNGIGWTVSAAAVLVYTKLVNVGVPAISVAITPLAIILAFVGIRFIRGETFLDRLGHLAFQPECFVKAGLIGSRPNYHCVILSPAHSAINPCLLNYWSRYFTIINNSLLVKLLHPISLNPLLQLDLSLAKLPDGRLLRSFPAIYKIQEQYEKEYGDQPVLSLSPSDQSRGQSCLQDMGIPQNAWFVCIHARERGYLPHLEYHSYRNADVNSYMLAMEAIIKRGGWIIRMGDPSMKPLPPMDQVIDYAHSKVRSDWMDIFCLARCRYFLGSVSGPSNVSQIFGVPCALTNYTPMGHGPSYRNNIWIPKLYMSVKENRYLTFREVLTSPLRRLYKTEYYDSYGVTVVDNSSEEIRDLAVEMMDRLDNNFNQTSEDQRLQRVFKTLLETDPLYTTKACVGQDFIKKFVRLLPMESSKN